MAKPELEGGSNTASIGWHGAKIKAVFWIGTAPTDGGTAFNERIDSRLRSNTQEDRERVDFAEA